MKSLLYAIPLCLASLATFAQIPQGYTPLFNVGSFDGWTRIGTSQTDSIWQWEGNTLKTTQGNNGGAGWIQYNEKMTDFEFYCEWKCDYNGNSGFLMHIGDSSKEPYWDAIEIQICEDPSFSWWWNKDGYFIGDPRQISGSVYGFAGGDLNAYAGRNKWNTLQVSSIGNRIKVVLNGIKMVDISVDDYTEDVMLWGKPRLALSKRPRTGYIGLQSHRGGTSYFRNVAIKNMTK
jgi:hypothetical protein